MQKPLPQMRSGTVHQGDLRAAAAAEAVAEPGGELQPGRESRADALDGLRIPAGDIEQLVTTRIGQFLSEPARLFEALAPHVETAAQQRRMLHRAAELAANWPALQPSQLRPMRAALIQRVIVRVERIDMLPLPNRILGLLRDGSPGLVSTSTEPEPPFVLSLPVQLRRVGFGIKMLIDETASPGRQDRIRG